MKQDNLVKLLSFVQDLKRNGIFYSLAHHRDDAIMVLVTVPGQRWEIEFFADGTVEAEQFTSNGDIQDENAVSEMVSRFGGQNFAKVNERR